MYVYLAGAMEHAPDHGAGWRREISRFLTDRLHHRVYNPCEEERFVLTSEEAQNFRRWKHGDLQRFRKTIRKIIDADLRVLISEVDYIICLWDEYVTLGGGTHGELTLAYHHQIPVYMVSDMPRSRISSWIIGCTTEMFADFQELQNFLSKRFPGG